jgi:hypothetical protein
MNWWIGTPYPEVDITFKLIHPLLHHPTLFSLVASPSALRLLDLDFLTMLPSKTRPELVFIRRDRARLAKRHFRRSLLSEITLKYLFNGKDFSPICLLVIISSMGAVS